MIPNENFHQSFFILVEELVQLEQLTDVTLACGDGTNHQVDNYDNRRWPWRWQSQMRKTWIFPLHSFCLRTRWCSRCALPTSAACSARTGTRRNTISSTFTGSARGICSSYCSICTGEQVLNFMELYFDWQWYVKGGRSQSSRKILLHS